MRPASGCCPGWSMCTHYDVEVLNGPGLPESVRHGVTTVLLGSCSLSTIHVGGTDAGDLFGRVEAIPREHVVDAIDTAKTWNSAPEYVEALESRPLGPNVAAFIGHSDMRTATMGLDRATRSDVRPTSSEQAEMERMLRDALDAGFVGLSSQQLLFDKIDGETCRSRTLPSTYAKPRELRRLKSLVRKRGRVLQSGPDIQNPLNLVSQVAQSLPVLRKKLKTSLLSAADVKANPFAIMMMGPVARLVNRFGGDFRWQHLPVPFEVYADGIDLVVFEEFGPARPRCTCATRSSATPCWPTRRTAASSARTTTASSVCGSGTGTSSTPRSSPAPTKPSSASPSARSAWIAAAASRRRVPGPGPRARHQSALAHNHFQPSARGAQRSWRATRASRWASPMPGAPAQHGVLQLRAAPAAARPRLAARRSAVHDAGAGRAPDDRGTRRLVRHRRRPPAGR